MSRFVFPPQIQQLKAANQGVIAFVERAGTPKELLIGVQVEIFVQPLFTAIVVPAAVPSVNDIAIAVVPAESPTISRSFTIEVMLEVNNSLTPVAAPSLAAAPAAPAAESPTVGVSATIVSVT